LFVTVPFELEQNGGKAELVNINEFGLCSSGILGDTATGAEEKRQQVGRKFDKENEKGRFMKTPFCIEVIFSGVYQ